MHHFSLSPYSSQMLFFTHFFLFSLTICFLLHATASSSSCTLEKLTCGNITMEILFPFFINNTTNRCSGGLHAMSCIDLVPAVKFHGVDYFYPVRNISYRDHTMIIYDLRLSSYFRGSDCNFFYDFWNPLPGFNFTALSMYLDSGESFYNCRATYNFSRDIFRNDYNLRPCQNYSLYYTHEGIQDNKSLPNSCSSFNELWFHWKLSFGEGNNSGGTSLLGAGFSPPWTSTDCFSCRFKGSNCSRVAGVATCSCSSNCQARKKSSKGVTIGISVGASVGVLLLGSVLCFIHLRRRRRHHRHPKPQHSASSTLLCYQSSNISPPFSQKYSDPACYPYQTHIFSYEELYEATNSFDTAMEVGDGGFGTVYKGKLRDGRAVAVKCLYESNIKRAEQFANEIVILSRVRHQNLVSLYGCTSPRSRELVLVYELVPNGTVADHLHGVRASEGRLNWPLRLSIAIETATALSYLHAIKPPIIHRDIKTGNILLDTEFHVKVADFGLSRLFPPDGTTHISTAPQGTPGYLDPEYHQSYQLTDRSDVYSFGVVLAELISSKPAVDLGRDRLEVNLSTMAVNRIQKGNLDDLMDRGFGFDSDLEIRRMMRLVAELAFRCLQTDREMRPPIKEVLEVLKGIRSDVSEGYSVEHVMGNEGKAKEKRPFSPDSVTEKWGSRSSTPASSH